MHLQKQIPRFSFTEPGKPFAPEPNAFAILYPCGNMNLELLRFVPRCLRILKRDDLVAPKGRFIKCDR